MLSLAHPLAAIHHYHLYIMFSVQQKEKGQEKVNIAFLNPVYSRSDGKASNICGEGHTKVIRRQKESKRLNRSWWPHCQTIVIIISFGVSSSKHTVLLPLCLLELTEDSFAPLMRDSDKGNRQKGIGCQQKGLNISLFLLRIRDKFVYDEEAMLHLYYRNPPRCPCTFVVPR